MKRLNFQRIKYLIFSLIHLCLGLSFILSNTYADLGLKDKWYRHLEKEQGEGAELSGLCLPKGRVEVEAPRVKATIPSITFAEISTIVDQLRLNPPILTPEQKVANLFLFYDIIKVAYAINEVFSDDRIIGKTIEGVRIIWSDSGISDKLLKDTMGQYFVYSPVIDWRLRMHFTDEINHFFVPRPLRYVSILSKSVQDYIFKRLLIENSDLKYFSSPISLGANSPETRTAFNYSLLFLDLLSHLDVDKLTIDSRNYLLKSTIDLIEKVSWLNQYAIYDDRDIILNNIDFDYRNAVREQVALHITRIFDLNPVTNEQGISDAQRADIKNSIKNVFNLSGLYAQSWDEVTILLSPGYFSDGDAPREFYYRLFKAYPSVPILLGANRLHFGGFHHNWVDANSPNDVYYVGSGVIEGTVHGVSHNVSSYLFRHQQILSRWEELVRKMNFECNQDLHAVYFFNRCATSAPPPGAGYWTWPERLADNIWNYTINTDRIFGLALEQFDKGYTNPIDMFLFMTGVFSVDISSRLSSFQTNVGRFFHVPDDYWYNFNSEKTIFTLTSIPLTRNDQNQITSLVIHERKYNFDLDTNGNVLNYTIEDISVPPIVSITEPLDNQEVEDTVTIKSSASDDRGVNRIEFYIDNTLHSADNTSPYESSWDTRTVSDGVHRLKAKAYDDTANNAEDSIRVKVNNTLPPPNSPPILAPLGNQSIDEGAELRFSISATDQDNDSISFTITNKPSGASFTDNGNNTATFSWRPDFNQAGSYSVTFSVTDNKSTSISESITITVNNLNRAPVLGPIGNQTIDEGKELRFRVTGSDSDNDPLTYTVSGLLFGAGFSNQTFNWKPGSEQAGDYQLGFEVSDGSLSDFEEITISVRGESDNQNPTISIAAPGNREIVKGGILIRAETTDNVGIEKVEFSIAGETTIDNSFPYEMDWNSRKVEDGFYALIAKAHDSAGNRAEHSIEIRVKNEPPLKADFTALPLIGEAPLTVQFTDLSTGKIDSWEWHFFNVSTGEVTHVDNTIQNPIRTFTQAGTYNVSLTVSKQNGEHHTESKENFILVKEKEVIDHPPVADAGEDQAVESGTLVRLDGSKSFAPDGDELSYQWKQLSGPLVQLEGMTNPIASFIVPHGIDGAELSFKLIVTAKDKSAEDTTTVVVKPKPPVPIAQFTALPREGKAPLTVQFTDQSTGEINSWIWDFGDGQTSSQQHPQYTYNVSGRYAVSLFVSGPQGQDKQTREDYITVDVSHPHPKLDHPPKARAGENQKVRSEDLVNLDGSKSADPDDDELIYQWRQLSGHEVVLSGNDQAMASFSAPDVKKETELKFELSVSANNKSDKDRIRVLVRPVRRKRFLSRL